MAHPGAIDESAAPDFCTLGMFIIDEIHFKPPIESKYDILGGAGSYAALGARLFSPPPLSERVGWIVHAGSDFPSPIRQTLAEWKTGCQVRETPERLTTRGWNGYGENEKREFKYTSSKLRLDADSLDDQLLLSKSFHLICSPSRCIDLVTSISEKRSKLMTGVPVFIWEPVPDLCISTELGNCLQALKYVDFVSPNHMELCGFFDVSAHLPDGTTNVEAVEDCCNQMLKSGIGRNGRGAVAVRVGKDGCYIASQDEQYWLPAYHGDKQDKVVDPTGGGNGFLGGFAVVLARSKSGIDAQALREAALCGSVAASFAIEQVGMPSLSYGDNGETWNGESVATRLETLRARAQTYQKSR